nr:putative major head protein [Acinetobacter phage Phanie]
MKVTQLATLMNTVTQEILGETAIIQEDLSNVVDIGKQIFDQTAVDNYVKTLVNHIGKVVFVNRLYAGGVPSVLMDSWEFGSVLEKISAEIPDAQESDTWKLEGGKSYDPDIFYKPSVSAKFFNSKTTFEIPMSFTERQVKESFSSAAQLNGFISMLVTSVENSMTVKLDALIMRTINNMTGEVLATGQAVQKVNLLEQYNAASGKALKAANALTDAEFIRFATHTIKTYQDRMSKISVLFNVEKAKRFTAKDLQHVVLLSDFSSAATSFLLADTQNKELITLPKHETVPYWQASGEEYTLNDVSRINVKTSSGAVIDQTGILGVIFDRDALGVSNLDRRVTTNYNPRAEFYTNFYKFDAGYFNDLSENFVVFYIAEDAPSEA